MMCYTFTTYVFYKGVFMVNNLVKYTHGKENVITIETLSKLIGVSETDIFMNILESNMPIYKIEDEDLIKFKRDNPSFKINLETAILLDYPMCLEIVGRFKNGNIRFWHILECFFKEEIQSSLGESNSFDYNDFYKGIEFIDRIKQDNKLEKKLIGDIKDIIERIGLGYMKSRDSITSNLGILDLEYRYFYISNILIERGYKPNKYRISEELVKRENAS